MNGIEELAEVQRILGLDFALEDIVEDMTAEQILTLIRACRASGSDVLPSDLSHAQIEAAARRGEVPCFHPGVPMKDPRGRRAHLEATSTLRVPVARRYNPVSDLAPERRPEKPQHGETWDDAAARITSGGCGHVPRPKVCKSCLASSKEP